MNDDARSALAIERPNRGSGITQSVRHKDNMTVIRTESKEKKKQSGLSMKLLTDILAPRFSYTRLGYGNDLTRRAWYAWEMSQSRNGTARICQANQGNQWWGEFLALPLYNAGVTKTALGTETSSFCLDAFTGNVEQLINKALDVRNETAASYRNSFENVSIMDVTNISNATSTTNSRLKHMLNNNFCYEGGYQEHTWENVGGSPVILEAWECIPRNPMPIATTDGFIASVEGGSSGLALFPNTIKRQLLKSYKLNLPLGNTTAPNFTANGQNNESTNNETDPCVRINKDSTLVHVAWFVKKPVKVTLQPGDRYTHRMNLQAFELDSTAMTNITTQVLQTDTTNSQFARELPCYIPKFTKVLAVRILGTTMWGGNSSNTSNTNAFNTQFAGTRTTYNDEFQGGIPIGLGEVRCIHQCNEHHSCRMLPEQFSDQHFVDDLRDRSNNAMYDINPETNLEFQDAQHTTATPLL